LAEMGTGRGINMAAKHKTWAGCVAAAAIISGALLFGYGACRYAAALPPEQAESSSRGVVAESKPMKEPSQPLSTDEPPEKETTTKVTKSILSQENVKDSDSIKEATSVQDKELISSNNVTSDRGEKRNLDDTTNDRGQRRISSGVRQLNRLTTSRNRPVKMEPVLLYPKRPQIGETFGVLDIPSIGKSLPIIHGTDEDELEKGVGHYADSVMPGEPDHAILSGHRDTVFRGLGKVQLNDLIIVKTSAGTFTYEVVQTYIVDRDDTTVIAPTPHATLSLSTCYPFNFIGDAPQRYIIRSVLIDYQLQKRSN
jgi:sortase A